MNAVKNVNSSRRGRRRMLAVAGVGACALSTVLLTAAPASADSRGFTVTNKSYDVLQLEGVNPVHRTACTGPRGSACAKGHYPIDFEGRPHVGDEIGPYGVRQFDLKWSYWVEDKYAAQLTYKIEDANAKLEIWIETTRYSNNSRCEVVPASAGSCTAGGLDISYSPPGGTPRT